MQKSSDVRVMGLVVGTHVIEDLGRDVPHGVTVTIPAEQAYVSKDLWRGISQKCLFHISSAPPPLQVLSQGVPETAPDSRIPELERRLAQLEAENRSLRERLRSNPDLEPMKAYEAKLDLILASLSGPSAAPLMASHARSPEPKPVKGDREEIADGTAPTFLPSAIVPKDAQTYIDVQGTASQGGAVSEAAERLRKLRKR